MPVSMPMPIPVFLSVVILLSVGTILSIDIMIVFPFTLVSTTWSLVKPSASEELAQSGESFVMSLAMPFVQIVNYSVFGQVLDLSVGVDHIGYAFADIGRDPVQIAMDFASQVVQRREETFDI